MTRRSRASSPDARDGRLAVGLSVRLDAEAGSGTIDVVPDEVAQRRWSRTAAASRVPAGERLFLKQFVGEGGDWFPEHFEQEQQGRALAAKYVRSYVVPPTVGRAEPSLVLATALVDMVTADIALRHRPERFSELWPAMCARFRDLVGELVEAGGRVSGEGLREKRREYRSSERALVFKGLDVRNLSLPSGTGPAYMVDVGKPYLGPVEDAAAKLFVSVGLLNWGVPLRRFAQGPPSALLADARHALAPWLNPHAVRHEIAVQGRFRLRHPTGSSGAERAARLLLIRVVGGRYLKRMSEWCERHGL